MRRVGPRPSAPDTPFWLCLPAADPHKIPIDPNGNLTQKTEGTDNWVYTWNAENQLTKVEKNGAEQARFAYDPLGRRVEKATGGLTTNYTYDAVAILRETRPSVSVTYVHGPRVDEPLASDDGTTIAFFHADGLGSVVRTTSSAGTVILTREYDAWGKMQVGGASPGYAYTGREWDPEVGLYYYRARYYDSSAGRFVSADPAGLRFDLNRYGYVGGRPVSYTDPTGLVSYNVTRRYYNDGGHHYDATGVTVHPDCTESKSCQGKWDLAFEVRGEIGIHYSSNCIRAHEDAHADLAESAMKSRLKILERAESKKYDSKTECLTAAQQAIAEYWNGGLWYAFLQLAVEITHPCF
jgi:RHS repeat-associated protein